MFNAGYCSIELLRGGVVDNTLGKLVLMKHSTREERKLVVVFGC